MEEQNNANLASIPESTQDSMLVSDSDEEMLAEFSMEMAADDPTEFVKPGKDDSGESSMTDFVPEYILGTLVVRVVAARDLDPVERGGLGRIMFGGGSRRRNSRSEDGTANPYASVKFGKSTQRSSEVFDSLNPIWPRQETMFMDVALPLSHVTHSSPEGTSQSADPTDGSREPVQENDSTKPPTVLTVAIFHTAEVGQVNKMMLKASHEGDSNDTFLGMASVDLRGLFTGKDHTFDNWLPLSGTQGGQGSVRIVCEYEASDPPPRPGDYCRFTRYCNARDLYPLRCGQQYKVADVDVDNVIISYKTQEGWVCTFQAHRFMLICEERHSTTVEAAQDELASLAERLVHSPLVHSITDTVERVAVDGLLNVGGDVVHSGISLLNRWLEGGVDRVLGDVADVVNLDGRHNPGIAERLGVPNMSDSWRVEDKSDSKPAAVDKLNDTDAEALPNMPCCPITGEPMADPVVAADGHTYERSAIARWLTTSNKSPMTGSILGHKELVPNYGLMSSVQEAATRAAIAGGQPGIPLKVEVDEVASLGLSLEPSLETMETVLVSPNAQERSESQ